MFRFFKKKPAAAEPLLAPETCARARRPRKRARPGWRGCAQGLRKTGSAMTQVFTGTRIDDALYEELEAALLMADAGVQGHDVPAGTT